MKINMISNMILTKIAPAGLLVFASLISHAQTQKVYVYQPDTIYPINAGLGIATQIILDPSEKVKDYGTGFSAGWELVKKDNIFYLKPKDADSETNMYIRTDKRAYLLDLKIVTKDWKKLEEAKSAGVTYSVRFTYPNDIADTARVVTEDKSGNAISPTGKLEDASLTSISGYKTYHLDYDFSSDAASKWLVPVKVYDNGKHTFIQMRSNANAPAFFGRSTDRGEEFLINKTLEKDTYILHGVYPYIVIRYGSNVVGIRKR
jgi:type IV secretion system protein VirB9